MQKLGKSPNFGVISEIQREKFGVFVIYIVGGKIWGSNKNFRGKIWGQTPQPPNNGSTPLGISVSCFVGFCSIFGNNCPWGGVLARFICPRGQSFALSLGGEFTLSKEFPGGSSGGWSGLELTYTLFSTVEIKI